jgi:tetratricopeptide (TPR) repeat protein
MKTREILRYARLNAALGHLDRAIDLSHCVLKQFPCHLEARLLLGSLLDEKGDEEAKEHFRMALSQDPVNWEVREKLKALYGDEGLKGDLARAEALWREGSVADAKRIVEGIIETYPNMIRALVIRADILLREAEEEEGTRLLHRVQSLDPSLWVAREVLGGRGYDVFLDMDPEVPAPEALLAWPEEANIVSRTFAPEKPMENIQVREAKCSCGEPAAVQLEEAEVDVQVPVDEAVEVIEAEENKDTSEGSFEPLKLIITSKGRLLEKYGSTGFEEVERKLGELEKASRAKTIRIYVDDEASLAPYGLNPVVSSDSWKVKALIDKVGEGLRTEGSQLDSLLIVGGDDILPLCRLPNSTDDEDAEILSDSPYAAPGDDYFLPTRAVGRLPDGAAREPSLLLAFLEMAVEGQRANGKGGLRRILGGGRRSFGLSAEIWKEASKAVFQVIDKGKHLEVSPPFTDQEFLTAYEELPPLTYFNLHGVVGSPYWYGQRASGAKDGESFPIAITPLNLAWARISAAVVYSEACYGAHLDGRGADASMALSLLAKGARGFVGSTGMAYGSLEPPLSGADLLGKNLWLALKQGYTIGEALRRAKIGLVEELARKQGFLDGEDQKTLLSFTLYGDPSLRANITYSKKSCEAWEKRGVNCPSIICGRKATRGEAQVEGEVVSKVKSYLEEHLPALRGSELKISSQKACGGGCNCGGSCAFGKMAHGCSREVSSLVFTSERLVPIAGDGSMKQVIKVTTDKGGNILKVAVSR